MKHITLLFLSLPTFLIAQQQFQQTFFLADGLEGLAIAERAEGGYATAGWWDGVETTGFLGTTDLWGGGDWINTYTDASNSGTQFNDVKQLADRGYILAGWIDTASSGQDGLLLRTDSLGQVMWSWAYGGPSDDYFESVEPTGDGGFIACGRTESFGLVGGSEEVFVLKTDANGTIQWARAVGTPSQDEGFDIIQTADGGYAFTGWSDEFLLTGNNPDATGTSNLYVAKLDATGNRTWSRLAGGDNFDIGMALQETSDGNLIVTGYSDSYSAGGDQDVLLLQLDDTGGLQWNRFYDENESFDAAFDLKITPEGDIAVCGYTSAGSFDAPGLSVNALLLLADDVGDLDWSYVYGDLSGDDEFYGLQVTADSGFVMTGLTRSFSSPAQDELYVVKTDEDGESNCNEEDPGFIEIDTVMSIDAPRDTSRMIQPSVYDPNLVATAQDPADSSLCLVTAVYDPQEDPSIRVFPNPATEAVTVTAPAGSVIEFLDLAGRTLASHSGKTGTSIIPVRHLPQGLYLLNVRLDGKLISTKKLVLQ